MYQNFTSLPPEQERTFVVYEQASVEAAKKARVLGIVCGLGVGLLGILLYVAYPAGKNPHAVDEEEPTELREEKAAPAPAAAAEEAPAEEAPAEEAPAEEAPAEEAE